MGMADGGVASVCAGCLSLVPALAVAFSALGKHAAAHRLDNQHFLNLRSVVSAATGIRLASSRLDPASGVWKRSGCRFYLVASATGSNIDFGKRRRLGVMSLLEMVR